MEQVDAVVVGAGVIGLSIATHLARRGLKPLVLERDHVCSGTTGQSGGVLRQNYSNPRTAALARDALAVFQSWHDHFEGDPGFNQCGVMFTAGDGSDELLRTNVAAQQALGIDTEIITPAEAAALDGRFNFNDCSAVGYEPTAGSADPVATTHAFAATARSLGVDIREGVEVSAVTVEGGSVRGVQTSDDAIASDIVVNAAGAWGLPFMAALGHELPIIFTRHPMALLRRAGEHAGSHPVVLDIHTDAYFIGRGDLTLVGKLGTMDEDLDVDPDTYTRGVTNAEIARYRTAAAHRMPALAGAALWGGWAGIYDESIDAHPIVDAVPGADGFYCALGMSGNCFKLSPIIGRLLADRIVDGPGGGLGLDLFAFDRFASGTSHQRAFGALSVLA